MFRLDGLSAFAWSALGALLCCAVYGGLWLVRQLAKRGHGEALDEFDDLDALVEAIRDHEETAEEAADILLWESECSDLQKLASRLGAKR